MLPISRRTISRVVIVSACLIFVVWGYSDYSNGIMPYGQAAGFLIALAGLIGSSRVSEKPIIKPSETEMAARDAHNRQAMLNRVRDFWVKGVLESSLHEEARIELGLEERRDAVAERPWDVILRTPDRPDCVLPPGTKISDVFERVGRSLLILGEPGAGKTTTLLELAREMIDRAEKDPSEKIPVVFNLSSWTDPKQTVGDWLTEELWVKYNIPKKIAASWVKNDSLLILLDGLDEVATERRVACVWAINSYLDEHLVPMAISCRKEDYEILGAKLKLQSAILLQSLTPEQIDVYLERMSPNLRSLREALRSDQELQEFAKTPLILSIMTLTYRGMPVEELQSLGSIKDRQRHLFKTYVDRMFERTARSDPKLYPKEDTIQWLSLLAQKMSKQNQTVFLIEQMQPSWLETKVQHRLYSIFVMLVLVLVVGLVVGLVFGLVVGLAVGPVVGLMFGLASWLVLCFAGGPDEIDKATMLKWSWKEVRSNLPLVLGVGLLIGLPAGLAVGLVVGLVVGLQAGLVRALESGLGAAQLAGLVVGLFAGQVIALAFGLENETAATNINARSEPNQCIKQFKRNALYFGLRIGLLSGLVVGLVAGLMVGLMVGLGFGVMFGLICGGYNIIMHYTLRFVLACENLLPWKLVSFLDYATERVFLRKVGGGYVFVHRMLMEYFASLEPGPEER